MAHVWSGSTWSATTSRRTQPVKGAIRSPQGRARPIGRGAGSGERGSHLSADALLNAERTLEYGQRSSVSPRPFRSSARPLYAWTRYRLGARRRPLPSRRAQPARVLPRCDTGRFERCPGRLDDPAALMSGGATLAAGLRAADRAHFVSRRVSPGGPVFALRPVLDADGSSDAAATTILSTASTSPGPAQISAPASAPSTGGSASGGAARSELVACRGASNRPPNQPAPAKRERGKHVLATVAPHIRRGSGSVVRFSLRESPDPHRCPTSFEAIVLRSWGWSTSLR